MDLSPGCFVAAGEPVRIVGPVQELMGPGLSETIVS